MQEKKDTYLDFLKRSDLLAATLGKNVEELVGPLQMSRASLFSYRTGKRPISSKAWHKLEAAERAAGLVQKRKDAGSEAHQVLMQKGPGEESFQASLQHIAAARDEALQLFPDDEAAQQAHFDSILEENLRVRNILLSISERLLRIEEKLGIVDDDGELSSEDS
ncbi:MAG: hypothetical protein ACQKBU_07855 [Verrucomicrobiales bacterium]